jgi:GT2 family glycosyltransferase
MTSLSVSIVSHYSDAAQLSLTLSSLIASIRQARHAGLLGEAQITLVDNTADAAEAGRVADLIKSVDPGEARVVMLALSENRGYGHANNQVIQSSGADLHLVLNPDVELDVAALTEMIACVNSSADIVLVMPSGRSRSGTPLYLAKGMPGFLTLVGRALPLSNALRDALGNARYELRRNIEEAGNRPLKVPLASGCCMLARGPALRACGGFDERYFMYFEDYDLSLRLGSQGSVMHCPSARIVHEGGGAARKGLRHLAWFARSATRFWRSHGFRWRSV